VGIQLEKPISNHPDFQINLENPPTVIASPTTEVVIPDLEDKVAATRSIWPLGKAIDARKKRSKRECKEK